MGQAHATHAPQSHAQVSFLTCVGEDLLLRVLAHLDGTAVTRLSQTCRELSPPCVTLPGSWSSGFYARAACRDGIVPWDDVFQKMPWSVHAVFHSPEPKCDGCLIETSLAAFCKPQSRTDMPCWEFKGMGSMEGSLGVDQPHIRLHFEIAPVIRRALKAQGGLRSRWRCVCPTG